MARVVGEKRRKRKGTAANGPVECCDHDWECEEDLRAVARAKAVHADPERLAKVQKLAKSKLEESEKRREEAQAMIDLGEGKNI